MPSVKRLLDQRVTAAMRAAYPDVTDAPAVVMSAGDPKFGDYQANGAMGLAKRVKAKPRDVAEKIVANLILDADFLGLCDKPEIAGPGFINLRLRPDWVIREIGAINKPVGDDRLGVEPAAQPETVVVDYSAPNLAKEMHVGHLRSTIIGDALARMLDFAGHHVVRQNHVGDWGTQFGMLVAELLKQLGPGKLKDFDIGDLEEFYRKAKKDFDSDPRFEIRAKMIVVLVQTSDSADPRGEISRETALQYWQHFCHLSQEHANRVYAMLGVLLTDSDIRGESAYNNLLPAIVRTLWIKKISENSQGAECVFLRDKETGKPLFVNKDGEPLPLIVQKSDEGYLYATTDLAAIAFRTGIVPDFSHLADGSESPHASRILYTVDARQAQHFKMVFETARRAGFAKTETVLEHIAFGTMMGADGKPFKTREGGTVKLMDLLKEAEEKAYKLVEAKNAADVAAERASPLTAEQMQDIAHKIGIGAVKYADLSQNRTSDYVFSWEKMLALDGNTAPYMQYAYARVRSIFRKAFPDADKSALAAEESQLRQDKAPIRLTESQELALAKKILQFAEIIDRALEDYRPNVLAAYLYDLAGAFTAFYDACPVIQSTGDTRTARLKLCDLTARVMKQGLYLLGIDTTERM
jgi:arginyl-tRNA synthetase